MCNLFRMDNRDWVNKWAQDAESLINLMPAYQINWRSTRRCLRYVRRAIAGSPSIGGDTEEGWKGINAGPSCRPYALQMWAQGRPLDGEAPVARSIETHSEHQGS